MQRADFLQALVSDLIVLQVHLHEAVVRQARLEALEPHEDALDFLRRLEPRLQSQVKALKSCLERFDMPPPRVKERLGALLGAAAGWVDQARGRAREVSRDLRDDFVVLSLVLLNYGMLCSVAAKLGDTQTEELASAHIDVMAPLFDDLMMIVPGVVEAEIDALVEDGD